jgi:hypothetical protein
MLFARSLKLLTCLSLAVGVAQSAVATPVLYEFTTDPFSALPGSATGFSASDISTALSGLSVSGSFLYDNASPLSSVGDSSAVVGEHNYESNPISNFSATVGGLNITGATGKGDVADEGYITRTFNPANPAQPIIGYADFLHFVSITDKGISLLNLPLVTARVFWIEGPGPTGITPDFLTSGDLPESLPALSGRFALDFVNKDADGKVLGVTTAFFNGLSVTAVPPTSVPEPGTLALLSVGCLLLIPVARRRQWMITRR